uniref:Uncharacterized protein n=1 Tax=Heterorhabditis bacteriophora TaxID=37862 RepID=A0A1I7X9R8_HETBA
MILSKQPVAYNKSRSGIKLAYRIHYANRSLLFKTSLGSELYSILSPPQCDVMSIALRVSTNHSYEQGEENTAIYRRYLVNRNFAALSIVVRHGVGSS